MELDINDFFEDKNSEECKAQNDMLYSCVSRREVEGLGEELQKILNK